MPRMAGLTRLEVGDTHTSMRGLLAVLDSLSPQAEGTGQGMQRLGISGDALSGMSYAPGALGRRLQRLGSLSRIDLRGLPLRDANAAHDLGALRGLQQLRVVLVSWNLSNLHMRCVELAAQQLAEVPSLVCVEVAAKADSVVRRMKAEFERCGVGVHVVQLEEWTGDAVGCADDLQELYGRALRSDGEGECALMREWQDCIAKDIRPT